METSEFQVLTERIKALEERITDLKADFKEARGDQASTIIAVHKRLDTFAGAMSRVDDVSAINNRIASELSEIEADIKDIEVIRTKVDYLTKAVLWAIALMATSVGSALMVMVLK